MKLLTENSPLLHLPIELGVYDSMKFDSIRTTLEILDYNYANLIKNLEDLSRGTKRNESITFGFTWSYVDYSSKLHSLFVRFFNSSSNHQKIEFLREIKSFRNSFQHLDERIDSHLKTNTQPIYGSIVWNFSEKINKPATYALVSGLTTKVDLNFKMKSTTIGKVENCTLFTIDNVGKTVSLNIQELHEKTKLYIAELDKQLRNSFRDQNIIPRNWSSKRDVLIKMINE